MKTTYSNTLNELIRWINNINGQMQTGFSYMHLSQEVQSVTNLISALSKHVSDEYPFYVEMLPKISTALFSNIGMGSYNINPIAFGQLALIVKHVDTEPVDIRIWENIHPRITKISRDLYCDGHYDSAAEKAIKEVETRLREKFSELKPGAGVPPKTCDIIGALLSDNGVFKFCDTSDQSGKDHRKGIKALFEGFISAYRNPSAHANLSYTKREALEQITLASQLIYILDKPLLP